VSRLVEKQKKNGTREKGKARSVERQRGNGHEIGASRPFL
jgi:hypothetical protein